LNRVKSGWIVNIPLDGTLVSLFFGKGDNITKLLKRGIPETKILETKIINSSVKIQSSSVPSSKQTAPPDLPKGREPIPPYIWWCVFGTSFILIFLAVVYVLLRKNNNK